MNYEIRKQLVDIAASKVGVKEKTRNSGKQIIEFQRATNLEGTGWPWCAAFMCWCIREWGKLPEVLDALKMTPKQFEQWRPKTAAAFGFEDWARKNKLLIMNDSQQNELKTGDLMVFDSSHIGIVETDKETKVFTIEGNTGPSGGNDGDGVWQKVRNRKEARSFIRIIPA